MRAQFFLTISKSAIPFIASISFFFACSSPTKEDQKSNAPNIVLMFTDELQFSDISAYGGDIPTPAIDQLANEGLKFTKAYTPASMCTPSRFSVLTGLYPGRCQAVSFLKDNPQTQPYNIAWNTWITPDLSTIPRVLSKNGYVTGMSGKWHIGKIPESIELPKLNKDDNLDDPEVEQKLKFRQEVYESQVKYDAGFDYADNVLWGNFDGHPIEALRFHNFPWITQGAMDFLDQQKSQTKPFFLYLTPTAIHGPNHVEDLEKDKTYTLQGRQKDILKYNLDEDKLKAELAPLSGKVRHRYAGISNIDYQLKLIREKLKEIGKADNTIIIFMSDHNIEPGKATSFEKGINIPMIVYWPGKTNGQSTAAMVSAIDVLPTILDIANIPGQNLDMDGQSFTKVLENPQSNGHSYIFAENGYTRSVSDGRYKFIALRFPQKLIQDMEENKIPHAPSYVGIWPQAHSAIAMNCYPDYFDQNQLYDLQNDPYELNNIYDENPEIAHKLKSVLQDHLRQFQHPFDLADIQYLDSEDYKSKYEENKNWDLANIPWLSRDHGFLQWPPQ